MEKEQKRLNNLKPVLYNQGLTDDFVVYDVERNKDKQGSLRKDFTLIYPQMLGEEFPKTFGHYHKNSEPELYEILEGQAFFLCQKHYKNLPLEIEEVYLIQAKKEDKIIILPGFSMTTINYGETNTLMSNWVHDEIENEYGLFSETHGACYYILKGDNNEIRFVKNDSYKKIPELIKLKPKIFPQELEDLDFLITPEKYQNFLTVNNLYEKIN